MKDVWNCLAPYRNIKIGYVLAYLKGLTADEAEDDAFCEKLYRAYEADPDKGECISLEDLASDLGVSL